MNTVSGKGTLLAAKVLVYSLLAVLVGSLEVWSIACVFVLFWINDLVAEQAVYRDLLDRSLIENKKKGDRNV